MVKKSSYTIVWDSDALKQLKDILTYLEEQSNQASKIVKKAIFERVGIIKGTPLICEPDKLKDPPNKEFRAFVVYSYRVTYQVRESKKEIRILRVRHTSREPLGY